MAEEKTLEKLDLNKFEAKDGKLTVKHIHQELETPRVDYEESVKMSGTIQAPGNFIEKRKDIVEQIDNKRCNVQYSYNGLYIKVRTQENWAVHYHVDGLLKRNPDISMLQINTKKMFSVKDLTQHIRMNKFFFADKDQNIAIVSNLQKFRVEAQTQIETENDNRGNAKDLYEIKNKSNLVLDFDLLMPIYVGQPAKKFRVEVAYAVRERNIEVWLESPELEELFRINSKEIIDHELTRFPQEFVFIEQ